MTEEWRGIAGWEDLYEVSDCGRVRALMSKGKVREVPLILKPFVEKDGRQLLVLHRDRKHTSKRVARLVLDAFGPPQPPGTECCHCDGDAGNDSIANLRWGTHKENMEDASRHGTVAGRRRRLDDEDVRCIRAEPDYRGVGRVLARAFDVSAVEISYVRNRKVRSAVEQWL